MNSLRDFEQLVGQAVKAAGGSPPKRVAVCAAEDESSLGALQAAIRLGLVTGLLIGEEYKIRDIMGRTGISPEHFVFHDVAGDEAKAAKAVELVKAGKADILMKGMLPTSTFLHPIFRHDSGLSTGFFISHIGVLQVEGYDRLILQTDGGLNIKPDFEMKKGIIKNAVFVAHLLGVDKPRVALLSASEKVHPKIQSSVDARDLALWAKDDVKDAFVEGPLSLDIAISPEAARMKGVTGNVAGMADILVADSIEVGNVVYKALRHFAGAKGAGIVVGAACPIVLTSRSDPPEEKLNSLALATLYAARIGEAGYQIIKKA